jgi:pimeloyl-ACP methyl ester carboxylesterase
MNKRLYYFLIFPLLVWNYAAAQDIANYFTSFDGTKIYYEVKGNGSPVVLVHGFIVNGETWKKTAVYNDLLNAGYKVISFDMRGNGRSDKPHDSASYASDAEAKDIMGLLNSLKVSGYDVIGYSRGAIITSRLLVLDPRVRHAVIGGMGSDFTDPEWPRRKMFYRALMGEPVKDLEGMVKYVKDSGLDQLALALLQQSQPSTSKSELNKLEKNVLVICGDKDADNGSARELADLIPKSTYKTVPGDHGSALRTAEFSKEVLSFFKANSP